MDMNSVKSSRRKAQVSTTCCPWVLITRTLCPRATKAALPRRAGMVVGGACGHAETPSQFVTCDLESGG